VINKIISRVLIVCVVFSTLGSVLFLTEPKAQAGYNPSGLCSDNAFINISTLDAGGIQNFLGAKGSFLANFSQGGRSAAQIIFDASRANGINPIAILATIQKEEGIIYGEEAGAYNQTRLDWAMGYGYTDAQIYEQYKGFTTQIDYGTWQLKQNFDNWATNGSEWNVGKTMIIDGQAVTFLTKCTSALYRYTPHLQGNYVFAYYFNLWGGEGFYDAQYATQGPRSGPGAYGVDILPNQTFTIWVNYRNTSNTTWYGNWTGDTPNPVHLGTANPQDRTSAFLGGRNVRGYLISEFVSPGQIGTFYLTLTAPAQQGTYVEAFRPVAEHIKWFGPEAYWYFKVSTEEQAKKYNAQWLSQGPRTGPGSLGTPLAREEGAVLWVNMLNTGSTTWYRTESYPTYLGTYDPQDRLSAFFGNRNRRSFLLQDEVPPGQIGTFMIHIVAPSTPGYYVEIFRPVTEYITWFGPPVEWQLTVQ